MPPFEHDEQVGNLGGFAHARGRHRLLDGWRRTVGRYRDPAHRRRFVSADEITIEPHGSDPDLLALLQENAGHEASTTFARLSERHRRVAPALVRWRVRIAPSVGFH